MALVVVPVRYPLNQRSQRTLKKAVSLAQEQDAVLSVLHVNLYQNGSNVTRTDLKREVERTVGRLPNARYTVRSGFLVEEAILDEVAAEGADVVVIGTRQAGRLRRILERFTDNPNIDEYLRRNLDCEVRTVDVS